MTILLRLVPVLVGVMLLVGCNRTPHTNAAPPAAEIVDPSVEVQTTPLRLGSITQIISASGSVVARRVSHIGTEVSGRIVRVHVVEGDRVEAGASLFDVDPMPYEIALRQAKAVLDVAKAERGQVEADLLRAKALSRQNMLAAQEIERLTTTLAVAQARERQASEAVALALHNLERTRVKAPFAGSVAERLADEGSTALVQPQTIVVVLQETAELEAQAAIPESQMPLVNLGDRAVIRIESVPDPIESHVSAVSDTIDPATRTYLVKMPIPNPNHLIKAGVFAHVEVSPAERPQMVLAPREAIRVEDGRPRLLLARDGEAVLIPIEVGAASEAEAEILSGATVGEAAIVGDAARTVAPGMRVRPAKPAAAS